MDALALRGANMGLAIHDVHTDAGYIRRGIPIFAQFKQRVAYLFERGAEFIGHVFAPFAVSKAVVVRTSHARSTQIQKQEGPRSSVA